MDFNNFISWRKKFGSGKYVLEVKVILYNIMWKSHSMY